MTALARAAALTAGFAIVLATWQSIVVTIILPRRTRNWIPSVAWVATYRLIVAVARLARDPAAEDALLALLGPVNIVLLLFVWLTSFVVGFALIFLAFGDVSFGEAVDLSGSSMLTLGFATAKSPLARILMLAAAASGSIVVALQIGYLPAIYAAYSQRESLVTLLNLRCQESGVVTGRNVLEQHPLPHSEALLRDLFRSWEACAASILESHTNYPWLIVFRSPRATESWITSMLAILDALAMLQALGAADAFPEAEHCRFACTGALFELAKTLRPRVARSSGRGPRLGRAEVRAALVAISPLVGATREPDEALAAFARERAAYEAPVLELGAFVRLRNLGWLRPLEA